MSFIGKSRADVEAQERDAAGEIAALYAEQGRTRRIPKTMGDLVLEYRTHEFPGLAASTKRTWLRHIEEIDDFFKDTSLAAMETKGARAIIKRWHEQRRDKPRTADIRLTVLTRILSWGVDEGVLDTNRALKIERLHEPVVRADILWSEDELSALLKHCSEAVGRAVRLAALTGLRKGDVVGLKWSDIRGSAIRRPTLKSNRKQLASIPLYPALRELLQECEAKGDPSTGYVITNSFGRPWKDSDTFDSSLRPALNAAGFKKKHFHDLRGTAATRMYAGGLSINQIAGIMGWSEADATKMARHYIDIEDVSASMAESFADVGRVTEKEGLTGPEKPE
jgi:integrase